MRTIVIQGAVRGEIDFLSESLPGGIWTETNHYSFYETFYRDDMKIVLSLTKMGIIHACVATMSAIVKYHPLCIINQGTAGGHTRNMAIGDIVIGESSVYLNNMRSPVKGKGAGSNALEWRPGNTSTFDLKADAQLVEYALKVPCDGRLRLGKLGAGDLFSREIDRIDLLHQQLGQVCEDMESTAVYKACHDCDVPVIGIRIISNNEITGEHDSIETFSKVQLKLQQYILKYIELLETHIR